MARKSGGPGHRTTFHLPVRGRTKGNGMGGHKRGINPKMHRIKNRGSSRQLPFKSENQRRYLWANHPNIAEAWAHGRSSVTGRKESASEQGKRKGGGRMARHKGRHGGRRKRK